MQKAAFEQHDQIAMGFEKLRAAFLASSFPIRSAASLWSAIIFFFSAVFAAPSRSRLRRAAGGAGGSANRKLAPISRRCGAVIAGTFRPASAMKHRRT